MHTRTHARTHTRSHTRSHIHTTPHHTTPHHTTPTHTLIRSHIAIPQWNGICSRINKMNFTVQANITLILKSIVSFTWYLCVLQWTVTSGIMAAEKKIVLVTGGTGLVGRAIETIVQKEEKRPNEEWFFASSKDADLSWVVFRYTFLYTLQCYTYNLHRFLTASTFDWNILGQILELMIRGERAFFHSSFSTELWSQYVVFKQVSLVFKRWMSFEVLLSCNSIYIYIYFFYLPEQRSCCNGSLVWQGEANPRHPLGCSCWWPFPQSQVQPGFLCK